ncbi:Glutamate synthase [NADPH] large chain [Candidatus Rhodobacter oscarellae]|uniref:Glutamate synthase [NADPH] large chain n=1 Tax=Candidatus Rhodobacter oscarellae TaxID=1675527 RepID=A0A0J9E020_9RHOB|nr:DNA-binding domain-containing protein [Candidatus Rhodobacter lobularis]KMW56281.1 Glutamate synthase [NADPH] large chain [Candidatus Rhodobacter lobularis]
MGVTQTEFTQAMLDPARAAPQGLVNPDGAPATKRFDVYRNNVAVSLTEALETAFPVIAKLIGAENFKKVAGVYLRQHPPSSPLIMFYGDRMPDFLAGFAPLQHLPYLADVARLEQALRRSYHAGDAAALDAAILQELPADRLMTARLEMAPAVHLIRSRYPIHQIWRFNMEQGAPKPAGQGENVLITRAEFDPQMTTLLPGGGTFVAAILSGRTFGEAVEAATAQVPGFDLTQTLGVLLGTAAIIRLNEEQDR